jgi:hypothetical protein
MNLLLPKDPRIELPDHLKYVWRGYARSLYLDER